MAMLIKLYAKYLFPFNKLNLILFQLSQTDELFNINSKQSSALTTESEINSTMQGSAQELLNCYVRLQGLNISQVILHSICDYFRFIIKTLSFLFRC